jgi:indolepyruvate ferredoxin oxidoreductase
MALAPVTLDDKYELDRGRVYLTGTQALVRLPIMQRQRDVAAGLNTGCFISGYRGSPLGGFDQALWSARRFVEKNHIKFQPAINEELGATAVWGSQQLNLFPDARYDGVFAMWYAKGPGVDRSGDALKHGNAAGSSRHGGVLLLAGDDHTCKSSTLAHQSEYAGSRRSLISGFMAGRCRAIRGAGSRSRRSPRPWTARPRSSSTRSGSASSCRRISRCRPAG